MEIYLVGGAVRDRLLGLTVTDRDWVVVGATPAEMESLGYKRVGKLFPVYLHPQTNEEYALARTERKTGPGYKGFEFNSDKSVSLEEDLIRRDLTINAMAETTEQQVIDPYGGQIDLKKGLLRHVSSAFVEDPVRILRVARFAAKFAKWNFKVAPATLNLMHDMVSSGEIDALVQERVWTECVKTLAEDHPHRFFEVLRDCDALAKIFPEIELLFENSEIGTLQQAAHKNTPVLTTLNIAVHATHNTCIRFATLFHGFYKLDGDRNPNTVQSAKVKQYAQHVKSLCIRLGVPNNYRDLAVLVVQYYQQYESSNNLNPESVLKLLEKLDAFRKTVRFKQYITTCEISSANYQIDRPNSLLQSQVLLQSYDAARTISAIPLVEQGLKGQQVAHKLRELRIHAIDRVLKH